MAQQTLMLIHGGLHEPVDARRFWSDTGVVKQLQVRGVDPFAPDRLTHPASWVQDAEHIAMLVARRAEAHSVIAGSNGCSTAVRLAIDHPELVERLVLCWPVTAGQPDFDKHLGELIAHMLGDQAAGDLLGGETLRGVSDQELAELTPPVAIMASDPENRVHQHATVESLFEIIPGAVRLPMSPETMADRFSASDFVDVIAGYLGGAMDSA